MRGERRENWRTDDENPRIAAWRGGGRFRLAASTVLVLLGMVLAVGWQAGSDSVVAQQSRRGTAPKVAPKSDFGLVEAITEGQLRDYLYFVASDEMEGRDTPSRGLDLTAKFLAMQLSRWGFRGVGDEGSFFQRIPLQSRRVDPERTRATWNGQDLVLGTDYLARGGTGRAEGPLVFAGHGVMLKSKGIDPYQGLDVRDRILVVADGFPAGVTRRDLRGKVGVDYDLPETFAQRNGARGLVILPGSMMLNNWTMRHQQSLTPSRPTPPLGMNRTLAVPTIVLSEKIARGLMEGETIDFETLRGEMSRNGDLPPAFAFNTAKQLSFEVNVAVTTQQTQNVVAVWEGSDPLLREEYVAVGAHYDHVGIGSPNATGDKIFNGADDDGSGTVAVLAIAEALAKGPRPRRSILLVWHTGEEKGLWGSEWVTEYPVVPLDKIIVQLNIDMIGRSKLPGDINPRNANLSGPNEIYVIGSKMMSTDLGALSEKVNQSYLNLTFNYKYDDPKDPERLFFRSDHYNYARKGIPVIFYFDGVHEDYHQASDHADKIDYQKMEKVTRTIFAKMWRLAMETERPRVDKQLPAQLAGE
jgi:hypothetical protein